MSAKLVSTLKPVSAFFVKKATRQSSPKSAYRVALIIMAVTIQCYITFSTFCFIVGGPVR